MDKLTKLGIITFSAVTLSVAVPTLVRAEENVAPQPNVAAQPNTTQPTPAPKPVKPAENAGLPKIPYRTNQPKRWFNNGTGRPTLTTNDLAAPLPAENVEKTSYGWWTAEPDLLHAGSHIKTSTFSSNFNRPMFENGKEINFKDSGFKDMDSRFRPALVRVKVPELEGTNYEAYTIFYEVPNKNGNPTYGTNRTLQGGNVALTFKSKEKKEDIQVYTLTKDKKLEELYYPGFPSEETNRYDEKTKTHSYNLYGETYDTYVFLFKNPAEKPAEQVKPEVKPSEQPKPDKQPSVPTVPAEQPQPAKPEKPTPTQSGWSGSSYYQNGVKVTNKWIFDKKYNSYFYLNASGNYVQNAWVGNYYLKSGGYMAKSEWIYDKNYGSYYYLTSEGSYARNTWVGNYYLKSNGKMAKSEWIYDKNYGAYYYLTAEGSYARNAWSGSYYLKSNGKMAKGEWIYDSNYSSYYYLTSEGSYARGTWVGDYYLKSNGKMAVNERTPDGYQVDGSGKWNRSQGTTSTASSSQATSLGISLYHVNDAMTYIDIALPSTPSSSYKVDYDFALVDADTGSVSTQTQFTVTYNPSLRAFQTRHFFSATPDGSYRFVIKGKGQDGKVYDGQSVVFRVKNHRFVG